MTPLHLVRLVLDRRALARLAANHRLSQAVDEGYLLHAGLAQLFATSVERAEVPLHNFAVDDTRAESVPQPGSLFVLAYAATNDAGLQAQMGPSRLSMLQHCVSTEMPEFERGQRLGFRTRVCPIVRTRIPGDRPLGTDRHGKAKAREMDAFVHATLGVPRETRVVREDVYADWLRAQVATRGGAEIEDVRLSAFQREGMRRRKSPAMERPNALMEGTLTVTDPAAFRALLARGIGRHRAFGFGMLLVRPPSR